jgi:CRP/FNR family transcriptional regulator, anaerobic regulatory protein
MVDWSLPPALQSLPPAARGPLERLHPQHLPKGTVIFQPGDAARGFALVVAGRIDVFLVGPTGRDILLYTVAADQSCVQTTLGLMGGTPYSAEAVAAVDTTLVLVPRALFLDLLEGTPAFSRFVYRAFAERMQQMMRVIERVAFGRVGARLAATLLTLGADGVAPVTQAELARRVGTAREVISRRLEAMAAQGLVATARGQVRLLDLPALRRLAADEDPAPL